MEPEVNDATKPLLEKKGSCPPSTSISILTDDTLLEIFHCYRLDISCGLDHNWWYVLMHTCRRWRYIILESSTSLQLHLHFTNGKPIEDMLKHSPSLPLHIDFGKTQMSTKDEEGVMLLLQHHHDRVCLINLREPSLQKLVVVMDKPFPMLEHLRLISPDPWYQSQLPKTFTAQRLRHLALIQVGDVLAPGIPLLGSITITGLVTLSLIKIPSPTTLPLSYLISRLSLMPLLQHLALQFDPEELQASSTGNVNRDLAVLQTQVVQLCKLDTIVYKGRCTYLEGLVSWICTPRLTCFMSIFFPQPSVPLPCLSEFLTTAEELRYPGCSITIIDQFEDDPGVEITVGDLKEFIEETPDDAPFRIRFPCRGLDVQAACAAQISTALAPMLSSVERLHLEYYATRRRRGFLPEVPREAWLELLRPFSNVQKLQLDAAMTRELSYALCPKDGPPAEGILPKLSRISRPFYAPFQGMLDPFIAAREAAGQTIYTRQWLPASHSESEEDLRALASDEETSTELDSDEESDEDFDHESESE